MPFFKNFDIRKMSFLSFLGPGGVPQWKNFGKNGSMGSVTHIKPIEHPPVSNRVNYHHHQSSNIQNIGVNRKNLYLRQNYSLLFGKQLSLIKLHSVRHQTIWLNEKNMSWFSKLSFWSKSFLMFLNNSKIFIKGVEWNSSLGITVFKSSNASSEINVNWSLNLFMN